MERLVSGLAADRRAVVTGAVVIVSAGAVITLARQLARRLCGRKRVPITPEKGDPSQPLVLYDVPLGLPELASSPSPFVAKLEAFLRFTGVEYTKKAGRFTDSPKSKLPYIQQGDVKVADSELIIGYLGRTYGGKVQEAVLPEDEGEAGVALAVSRMVEGHLFFGLVWNRMNDPTGWAACKRLLLGRLPVPALLRPLVEHSMKAKGLKTLEMQGMADHCESDVLALVGADIKALSQVLGKKQWFCGNKPHAVDAVVFGMLDSLLNDGISLKLRDLVLAHPNLVKFVSNVRKQYFGLSG